MRRPFFSQRSLSVLSLFGVLLVFGSGCGGGATKLGKAHWNSFDPNEVAADIEWVAGSEKRTGNLLFQKPFSLRVKVKGEGEMYYRPKSVALTKDPWRGGIELRGTLTLQGELLWDYLGRMNTWIVENYDVESIEGPEIAGQKTKQVTLKPKAAPKLAGLNTITDQTERYWLDAKSRMPLRYALLGPDGTELYSWELSKLNLTAAFQGTQFYYFPLGDSYSIPLHLPTESTSVNVKTPIDPLNTEQAQKNLGYPLFILGQPWSLKYVTVSSNRPLSDYSSESRGGFTYLLQAPLVDSEQGALELKAEGDTWKVPRRERFFKGQDFGPDNVGMHHLEIGSRKVSYDNFCGIKAFGWTENGHAMTLITTGDFREALVSIAAGRFP